MLFRRTRASDEYLIPHSNGRRGDVLKVTLPMKVESLPARDVAHCSKLRRPLV